MEIGIVFYAIIYITNTKSLAIRSQFFFLSILLDIFIEKSDFYDQTTEIKIVKIKMRQLYFRVFLYVIKNDTLFFYVFYTI